MAIYNPSGVYENYDPPPPVSVSLDPEKKTSEQSPRDRQNRGYVFRKHLAACDRLELWLRMRCPDEKLKTRALACGTDAWIDQSPSTGRFRLRCNRCNWRCCPLCRVRWGMGVRDKINFAVAAVPADRRKLATFTLRSSNAPLADSVKNLWQAFRRLRQRTFWKKAVSGSIAVLEVTLNANTGQWHPHLHVILDAAYMDQKALSREWLQVTLTSKIVDIRALRSFTEVAKYVTKYLLKATELPASASAAQEDELYGLFRKARFVRYAGTLRPQKGEEPWRPEYPTDWHPYKPLAAVLAGIVLDDPEAQQVLDAVARERVLNTPNEKDWPFPE